jgi:hypothetical protein
MLRFENRGKGGINAEDDLGLEIDINNLKFGD